MPPKEIKPILRTSPTPEEFIDMGTQLVSSAASNLTNINDPTQYLLAVASSFFGQRINTWSAELKEFVASRRAKKEGAAILPQQKLIDTFKFFKEKLPTDDELLEALRYLHIVTFTTETTNSEAAEVYILLDTARKLSGPEVITILSAYKLARNIYKENEIREIFKDSSINTNHAGDWCRVITRACGYSNDGFVYNQQDHLEDLKLIKRRDYRSNGITRTESFEKSDCYRLTETGERLAEFIIRGESIYNSFKKAENI